MIFIERILPLIYILPAVIAFCKRNPNWRRIACWNLLLGWTGVGWIVLMLYALEDPEKEERKPLAEAKEANCFDKLAASKFPEVSVRAKQARDQDLQLAEQREAARKILDSKFAPGEITKSRYSAAIFNVLDSVDASIHRLETMLQSMVSICGSVELTGEGRSAGHESLHETIDQCDSALEDNREAFAKVAELLAGLASLNLVEGKTPSSLEASLAELGELKQRVRSYGSSS